MRAGKKRHLITIQQRTDTKSSTGAVTTTWTKFKSLWANVSDIRGYEKESANAAWPGSDSKIMFSYVSGLLPTMRILFNDKIYSILDIENVEERNRNIKLICQSGVKAS